MIAMDRRVLLQRALLLAGATLTPGFSLEALAQEAAKPHLLDPGRFALLTAVAATIVPKTDTPGAVEAGVPTLIDGLLRDWASPKRRADLIAALDAIGQLGGGFVKLPESRRYQLLAAHDAAALKPAASDEPAAPSLKAAPSVADPNYGGLKQESPEGKAQESVVGEKGRPGPPLARARGPMMMGPPVADPAYAKLKELIVVLYYYSEPALTQELRYEHAPGAWQPSIPINPQTRPWGGFGNV